MAVLARLDVVSRAVLTLDVVHISVGTFFDAHLLPDGKDTLECFRGMKLKFLTFLLILFLRVWFVYDVVLLVSQVHTQKTVLASFEIKTERTVTTVF